MRICRTFCTSAGYDTAKIQKIIDSNADAIMLDIEDGVVPNRKEEARQNIAKVLKELDFRGKIKMVRVNALGTGMTMRDLDVVIPSLPDEVKLPKCESKEDIRILEDYLAAFERNNGYPEGTIKIGAILETPLGVANCLEIATASKRIVSIGLGMEDITGAYGITRRYHLNNTDLLYIKQKMILAAKVAGIGVTAECVLFSSDPEYMREDTIAAKACGYTGRSVFVATEADFHNVDVINEIFSPSAEDVDWSHRVIDAYNESAARGESSIFVDGKFIDPPVITKAQKILAFHEAILEKERRLKA